MFSQMLLEVTSPRAGDTECNLCTTILYYLDVLRGCLYSYMREMFGQSCLDPRSVQVSPQDQSMFWAARLMELSWEAVYDEPTAEPL